FDNNVSFEEELVHQRLRKTLKHVLELSLCIYLDDRARGRIYLRRTFVTGFLAQSNSSSNTVALDSPYLLVLNTGASQSRQHARSGGIYPGTLPLDRVEVLVQTEMELELEQSQQGSSYEFSADMSAVSIENSAINVFPNCKCVCNPCPVKAEPAQNGSSCRPTKKQSDKHNRRSSAKDSESSCWPSSKKRQAKKQGWRQWLYWRSSKEVAKTKDNNLVPPLADVELSKTATIGGGPNIGEGVQLSRMPSLDMDLIWDALLVSDA
nr:ethylene-responsive transcription factor ERF062-like [Tanacetum cinerariifolium]